MNEEKVRKIETIIPEEVLKVFRREFAEFIDSCSQNTTGMIEDETGDGEDFNRYLDTFMSYPHY